MMHVQGGRDPDEDRQLPGGRGEPSTLDPTPSTLNPQPYTLTPKP
jgi:hypothetical protein